MTPRPVPASEPEWRLFAALVGARRILAPAKTPHGRLLQAVLARAADALDWVYLRRGRQTLAAGDQASSQTVAEAPPAPLEADAASAERLLPKPMPSEPFGTIDGPAPGSTVRGMVFLWGCALDRAATRGTGVTAIGVLLDGLWQGTATYGIKRYDVEDQFGTRFVSSGWRFALDLQNATPGSHIVQVLAYSSVSRQDTAYNLPVHVAAPAASSTERKLALFIAGCPGGTRRYRCDHQAEQLQLHGASADVAVYGEVALADVLDRYDLFVLQRVLLSEDVDWFIDQARRRGRKVVFDTDDLIFDADAVPFIAALELFNNRQREHFLDCLARGRDALARCDGVLVSTELLRERATRFHQRVAISPNVVDQAMVAQADTARQAQGSRSEPVVMAYLSGTPTHDRDFLEVADALVCILDSYPLTRLRTVGPVWLDTRFDRFEERVEQLPLQPWQRLPELLPEIDINLAPLEPNNLFTDAKSCVKYLEAALLGVPTIASPRPDFRRAIRHGDNGLLACDQVEWQAALKRLIESPAERRAMGQRARQDVLAHHTTLSARPTLLEVLREVLGSS